jgi:hypothetical protein
MNTDQVINPFSDAFAPTWTLWKAWRLEHDKFRYRGLISEQMALKKLVELSEGDEQRAVLIVEQSISREWTGFYPLKQPSNGRAKKSATTEQKQTTSLRERVIQAANKRYNGGEESGNESHLKAV